jgi:hypothetical protein
VVRSHPSELGITETRKPYMPCYEKV